MACSGAVQVRYRYRLYPTPGQQQALARAFGCARVVYNDCLRLRDACHASGEKISDTEVQRGSSPWPSAPRNAPGWARSRRWRWCRHARTPAAPTGTGSIPCRAGGRAARSGTQVPAQALPAVNPAHPQRVRHARSQLYVAKVGDIKVGWSRDLPSVPSSVTVIREPDGRYYASFVVERAATPLPLCDREIGVDVGLSHLAVTSDGEVIGNPRFMRAKERKLARAQRALSRKQKGSANRAKARQRVAVVHRKVRESRLDHAHKTALRLVRDNQAVYAEDLCVSGLARTRLAKSVHDAGWSQLVRLIEEKAVQYGRTFVRIGRFEPTSQVCSACGVKDGPKPLHVRQWTCAACGTIHDRDVNAAKNILAAGRADKSNACRGSVRPGLALAAPGEAGTHRSAA